MVYQSDEREENFFKVGRFSSPEKPAGSRTEVAVGVGGSWELW